MPKFKVQYGTLLIFFALMAACYSQGTSSSDAGFSGNPDSTEDASSDDHGDRDAGPDGDTDSDADSDTDTDMDGNTDGYIDTDTQDLPDGEIEVEVDTACDLEPWDRVYPPMAPWHFVQFVSLSSNKVLAVTEDGELLFFDGSNWRAHSESGIQFDRIAYSGWGDLWATGVQISQDDGEGHVGLFHYDGVDWSKVLDKGAGSIFASRLRRDPSSGRFSVWWWLMEIELDRFDGQSWQPTAIINEPISAHGSVGSVTMSSVQAFHAIDFNSFVAVFYYYQSMIGSPGQHLRYLMRCDEDNCEVVLSDGAFGMGVPRDVWGDETGTFYVLGKGGLFKGQDDNWERIKEVPVNRYRRIVGTNKDTIHLAGQTANTTIWVARLQDGVIHQRSIGNRGKVKTASVSTNGALHVGGEYGLFMSYMDDQLVSHNGPVNKLFSSTWTAGPEDILVASIDGDVIRGHDRTWELYSAAADAAIMPDYSRVWGRAVDDIYIYGGRKSGYAVMHRFDGVVHEAIDLSFLNPSVREVLDCSITPLGQVALVAIPESNPYVKKVFLFEDGELSEIGPPSPARALSVWAAAQNDVYIAGGQGVIRHYDGASWKTLESDTTERLVKMWGVAGHEVYIFSENGTLIILKDNKGEVVPPPQGVAYLRGVWSNSAGDAYFIGEKEIDSAAVVLRLQDGQFSEMWSEADTDLRGIWGRNASDIWAVGTHDGAQNPALILHFNGSTWSEIDLTDQPADYFTGLDVWGSPDGGLRVTDSYDRMLFYDDGVWHMKSFSDMQGGFSCLVGDEGGQFFLGNNEGALYGLRERELIPFVPPRATEAVGDVWGSAGGTDLFVGSGHIVSRIDGSEYLDGLYFEESKRREIWGRAGNEVYAVGGDDTVAIFNGESWHYIDHESIDCFNSVAGIQAGTAYFSSCDGRVTTLTGEDWLETIRVDENGQPLLLQETSSDTLFARSNEHLYQFDGDEWSEIPAYNLLTSPSAIAGGGEEDLHIVTEEGIWNRYCAMPQAGTS